VSLVSLSRALRARPASLGVYATVLIGIIVGTTIVLPASAMAAVSSPPVATPGPGPQKRPLPAVAVANHGYPKGVRPPVLPPGLRPAGKPHASSTKVSADGQPTAMLEPSTAGAVNLILRPGFAFNDTSLVLYFDAADPGITGWTSWRATVYDPSTGAAQESAPLSAADAARCVVPAQYCHSFGAADGWALVGDHGYYVTITVTLAGGTEVVSAPSATVKARVTSDPPALPAGQTIGCACGNALSPTTIGQAVRGSGVNTGTGAFSMSWPDLRLPGYGITFDAVRMYSSANTTAGSLGIGWSWTYDLRVIPPAAGSTSVTVRAEDGAQVVYTAGSGTAYNRPPGVRSNLSSTASGWKLVTPSQITYTFDTAGRLTSVRDSRNQGISLTYTATRWTLTDAAGRVVLADVGTNGLISKISLPDGRNVRYIYTGNLLTSAIDAAGKTWAYAYTGQLLTTVTDPTLRAQVTNTFTGGRVTRQVDASGAALTFAWVAALQEATTTDADGVTYYDGYRGNVLVYSQNGNGDTVHQRYDQQIDPNLLVDPQGNQVASVFDQASNLTSMTAPDPFAYSVTNTYDARNNLTTHVDALGHTARFGYTAFDELASITTPADEETTFIVDSRGLMTQMTDPRGKSTNMTYDAVGNLLSVTTPLGQKTTYTYDASGRVISIVDPRGNVAGARALDFTTTLNYDALDRVTERRMQIKARGLVTVYDAVGQVTKMVDELNHEVNYAYTAVIGRTASITDPNGNVTSYTYTAAGRRQSTTDPMGNKTTIAYDNRGNPSTVVSARGNVTGANPADFTTTYIYDFNSNRVRISHPYPGGGTVTRDTRFDELNRPVANTDSLGNTSIMQYDNNGNVVSASDPLGGTTTIGYDVDGRPTAATAPGGGVSRTEYDAAGNVIKSIAADGGATTYTYNDNGDVATVVDARGNVAGANPADYTVAYAYDAARHVTSMTNQLGEVTGFTYDPVGRISAVTDAKGHASTYKYDDADHITRVIGHDGDSKKSTNYLYDNGGRILSRTDPLGNSRYTYDKNGRVIGIKDPLNRDTLYTYDAEGNLTQTTVPGDIDPALRSVVNTYDILNRHVRQDQANGALVYTWGYDARNRLTSLADPTGVRSQTYDAVGRIATVSRDGNTFRYGYDANGNVNSRTWPDGTVVTTEYNASNQMTALTAQGGSAGPTAARYTFSYDPTGRTLKTTYPTATGMVTDRSYDQAGRLNDLNTHDSSGVIARYQLTRDSVGNPSTITTSRGARTQKVAYTYDVADRLTGACIGNDCTSATEKIGYTYDTVGNRLTQTTAGVAGNTTTTYAYDSASQLTGSTFTGPGGTTNTAYTYDRMGNMVQSGDTAFTYNLDHTLASASAGGVSTSYTYDAQGNRLSANTTSTGGTQTRTWQTDVNGRLPQVSLETTAQGSGSGTTRGFLSAGGAALGLLTGAQTDAYAPDFLGGVADVIAPGGGSLASYDYDPFGGPRTNGTASTTTSVDNPIRFAGGYQDSTLGNRYTTPSRIYDPGTGRFTGVDPVGQHVREPGRSPYAYVGDKPTVYRDPSGATCEGLGGNPDHDAAVALAAAQLDIVYGPWNVYAECPPSHRLLHGQRTGTPSGLFFMPGVGYPELIAALSYITYVWEVKPATDQGSSIRPGVLDARGVENARQVAKYVKGLASAGYPNVQAGPDILPSSITMPDGGLLTIFSGSEWEDYARKGARPADDYSGIIYYRKDFRSRVTPSPSTTPNEGEAEADESVEVPATTPAEIAMDPGYVESDWVGDLATFGLTLTAVVLVAAFLPEIVVVGGAVVLTKSMFALAA